MANHAILLQQIVSRRAIRSVSIDDQTTRLSISGEYERPDPINPPAGIGYWRPFQIGFLLATIQSAVEGNHPERETVELIWFPTGGGKTEAYLGLAAFCIFMRRLGNSADAGTDILMRYTLRLLTAQQFQRASGLICAMEMLRQRDGTDLGPHPFTIGMWLGGDTTPNTRAGALKALRRYEDRPQYGHPFVLEQCPWCGAQFTRLQLRRGRGRRSRPSSSITTGLVRSGGTVKFACPDRECPFTDGLPILVIDEDIYETPPTFVIATIDKFAMMAWNPNASTLMGIGPNGRRQSPPPGLIIQDELHLISGPLGSLSGLFETAVEALGIDEETTPIVRPKIVCSTATIRTYRKQIRRLYARESVLLFPPPGLDADDSFFAQRDDSQPGRMYVGVHAPSLGSVQTQWARTFASLLQAPTSLPVAEQDPWWTMMIFFNSIREMGTAHTLFVSDLPDHNDIIWNRKGTPRDRRRYLPENGVFELTSGLRRDEIAGAISRLEVPRDEGIGQARPIDVCLASSIIEVGIDIRRLSLLVVAGQPKTTSPVHPSYRPRRPHQGSPAP